MDDDIFGIGVFGVGYVVYCCGCSYLCFVMGLYLLCRGGV